MKRIIIKAMRSVYRYSLTSYFRVTKVFFIACIVSALTVIARDGVQGLSDYHNWFFWLLAIDTPLIMITGISAYRGEKQWQKEEC